MNKILLTLTAIFSFSSSANANVASCQEAAAEYATEEITDYLDGKISSDRWRHLKVVEIQAENVPSSHDVQAYLVGLTVPGLCGYGGEVCNLLYRATMVPDVGGCSGVKFEFVKVLNNW